MRTLHLTDKIVQTLNNTGLYFSAGFFYPLITVIIIYDVMGRWLFNSPLSWSTEATGLLQIMAVFLACASTDATDSHIRLDIFYNNFSKRTKHIIALACSILAGCWTYIMAKRSLAEVFISYESQEGGMDVPLFFWPIRIIMTLAFVLLGIQLALSFFTNLSSLLHGEKND